MFKDNFVTAVQSIPDTKVSMITDMMYVKYNTVGRAKHAREEIHPDFETQHRRHQKSNTEASVATQKRLISSKIIF